MHGNIIDNFPVFRLFGGHKKILYRKKSPPKGRISSHLSHLSANCGWRIKSCLQASGFNFNQSQRSANSGRRDNIRV
jgi:hypothetical protein